MKLQQEQLMDWHHFFHIDSECLTIKFGKSQISLYQNGHIEFTNGKALVKLDQQGGVILSGDNLQQHAKQQVIIHGAHSVHLNSEH